MRTILCLLVVVYAVNAAMIPRDTDDAASMVEQRSVLDFFNGWTCVVGRFGFFGEILFFLDNFQFF